MNIMILGATGYLGYNIASKLVNSGNKLFCVVRHTSDCSRLTLLGSINIIFDELGCISKTMESEHIDWVINCVCIYSPNDTLYGDMLDSNVVFPSQVLNLAVKYHIKNFMTMGTSLPKNLSTYSFTKSEFSEWGRFLSEKKLINFVDLKLEMFYGGANEPHNRFIEECITKMKKNEDLYLTDGEQKRDLICVDDISDIVEKLLSYIGMDRNGYYDFQVGSGSQHSIKEIIEFLKNEIGSTSTIHFGAIPKREGEPDTLADTSWYSEIHHCNRYSYFDGLREECNRIKL